MVERHVKFPGRKIVLPISNSSVRMMTPCGFTGTVAGKSRARAATGGWKRDHRDERDLPTSASRNLRNHFPVPCDPIGWRICGHGRRWLDRRYNQPFLRWVGIVVVSQ